MHSITRTINRRTNRNQQTSRNKQWFNQNLKQLNKFKLPNQAMSMFLDNPLSLRHLENLIKANQFTEDYYKGEKYNKYELTYDGKNIEVYTNLENPYDIKWVSVCNMSSLVSSRKRMHIITPNDQCQSEWHNDCARCAASYAGLGTIRGQKELIETANRNWGIDPYNFNLWLERNTDWYESPPQVYYINSDYIKLITEETLREGKNYNKTDIVLICTKNIADKLLKNHEIIIAGYEKEQGHGHYFNIGKFNDKIWYIDPQDDLNPGIFELEETYKWEEKEQGIPIINSSFVLEPWQAEKLFIYDNENKKIPMLIDAMTINTTGGTIKKNKYTKKKNYLFNIVK